MKNDTKKKLVNLWNSSSLVGKVFLSLGTIMGIGIFLVVNFNKGLTHDFQREFGTDFSLSKLPYAILYYVIFVLLGCIFSLITSSHWVVLAWLSGRNKYHILTGLFGIIMFILDGFLRINAVFFSVSSTGPVAIMFIPFIVGIPTLVPYVIMVYFLGKFQHGIKRE